MVETTTATQPEQDYAPAAVPANAPVKLEVRDLSISYEGKPALVGVSLLKTSGVSRRIAAVPLPW